METSEVMLNGKLVKPLSELSVHEVGIALEALKLGKYKETLLNNEIDGKCLMKCHTIEDVVSMGIPITVKASLLLDEIRKWKAASQDDDFRNAEIKSPFVSYDPLTITHVILLYSTSHLSICVYTLIGCSIVSWGYFRSHVEW